jgi:hypothetical protein
MTKLRAIAGVGLLTTVALLLGGGAGPPWSKVLEGGLYASGLLLLATQQPLRQVLAALPRPQQCFLLCLTALLLATQIVSKPRGTFPFIPWMMYSERLAEPPPYLEYVGICGDGREVVIPAAYVFRSLHRTVYWRLWELWEASQSAEGDERRAELERKFRSLLAALVERFNAQNPQIDVQRVRLVECTLPRPAPGRRVEAIRRPLIEIPLE